MSHDVEIDATKFSYPFNGKWILYLIAVIIFFVVKTIHLPEFNHNAHLTFAIFCVAAFLWITSALPLAITGIVILLFLPMTGAITTHQMYSYFGNDAVFFVLGAFILASPIMRSGISTRVAVGIISRFGKGPVRLLFSIFLLSLCMSFIISEHAVAAMLLPIVLEIVAATGVKPGSRFGFAAFLAMGWGACIGGTATLLGGARAPLALGILQSTTGQSISFIGWFVYSIPTVLIIALITFILIYFLARNTTANIPAARAQLELHHTTLGKLSPREIYTILIIGLTVILWIFYGTSVGLDVVAFIGVLLAFAFRITTWREVEKDVQWSIFIMYGSAIALSAALRDTGAATALVHIIINSGIQSPLLIFVVMVLLAFVLTEAMSNAASVAVLMPIGLALAKQYHIDPKAMALGIATSAGLTFMLPVSTPAMAIITSCKYVNPNHVLKWGALIKVLGIIILLLIAGFYWPLFGIHI